VLNPLRAHPAMDRSPQLPAGAAAGGARGALHPALPSRLGHHSQVKTGIEHKAREVDQATAALITDLKERGCPTIRRDLAR